MVVEILYKTFCTTDVRKMSSGAKFAQKSFPQLIITLVHPSAIRDRVGGANKYDYYHRADIHVPQKATIHNISSFHCHKWPGW